MERVQMGVASKGLSSQSGETAPWGQGLRLLVSGRPPALAFIVVGGAVLAFAEALIASLQVETGITAVAEAFALMLLINFTALASILIILGAFKKIVSENLYRGTPRFNTFAVSYGSYIFAGAAATVVHYSLLSFFGLGGASPSVGYIAADSIMLMMGVITLGFLSDAYYTVVERLRAQQATLHDQVNELEKSRQQITVAEENLRREIAEMLHGRVQSRLVVAWHQLGQCEVLMNTDPKEAQKLLAHVRQEIDQIREHEIREASHLLHPSIIQVGLLPAVRSLIDRFVPNFKVALHIDPKLTKLDDPANNRIEEDVRLVGYRVLEEAFSNIYRHAQATRVDVSLAVGSDQQLGIVVLDDGAGFDANASRQGLGLNSIAARVGQSNGTWTISSAPGKGTRLSTFLPLRRLTQDLEDLESQDDSAELEPAVAAERFARARAS